MARLYYFWWFVCLFGRNLFLLNLIVAKMKRKKKTTNFKQHPIGSDLFRWLNSIGTLPICSRGIGACVLVYRAHTQSRRRFDFLSGKIRKLNWTQPTHNMKFLNHKLQLGVCARASPIRTRMVCVCVRVTLCVEVLLRLRLRSCLCWCVLSVNIHSMNQWMWLSERRDSVSCASSALTIHYAERTHNWIDIEIAVIVASIEMFYRKTRKRIYAFNTNKSNTHAKASAPRCILCM